MSVRFSTTSTVAPFSAKTIELAAGAVLTAVQVSWLVKANASSSVVTVACDDRTTLLAVQKTIGVAVRASRTPSASDVAARAAFLGK